MAKPADHRIEPLLDDAGITSVETPAKPLLDDRTASAFEDADLRRELANLAKHIDLDDTPASSPEPAGAMKHIYFSGGIVCVALGMIGIAVPVFPTTVFMIIALWAFGKSSPAMRAWMLNHRHFGPTLQNWVSHRTIPTRARQIAFASLLISALFIGITVSGLACLAFILFVCVPVATYLWTLPSTEDR